jgi:hypothetical protein
MASRHPSPAKRDNTRARKPLPLRDPKPLLVALAILLTITGLLLFAHAQTQPLFQDMRDSDATSIHNPRDDGGILIGSLLAVGGITLLASLLSPLRGAKRLVPAGIFAATTTLLLAAHFSIFTNGMGFPDANTFAVQSTYLFHDTHSTLPIATFVLAFITFIVLLVASLALWALLAPRSLHQYSFHPRHPHAHRARILVLTLLILAAGATFTRQFFAFTTDAAMSLDTRGMAMVYLLMGTLTTLLLLLLAYRTHRLLWGGNDTRGPTRKRRAQRLLNLETALLGLLIVFTTMTLFGNPVWEPQAGTDPVFAISSTGISWVFLLLMGAYGLHRVFTRSYQQQLRTHKRPSPTKSGDPLFGFALLAVTAWTAGSLWSLVPGLTPLGALALRITPIVLLAPFVILRTGGPTLRAQRPMLTLAWANLSVLAAIMLWGIGNSMGIQYSAYAGGLSTTGTGLFEGTTAWLRLAAGLLLIAPLIVTIHLLCRDRARSTPWASLALFSGVTLFALHVLLSIQPVMHHDPINGETRVFVTTWLFGLSSPSDTLLMTTLSALTLALGLTASTLALRRAAEVAPHPLPTLRLWATRTKTRTRRPIPARRTHRSHPTPAPND